MNENNEKWMKIIKSNENNEKVMKIIKSNENCKNYIQIWSKITISKKVNMKNTFFGQNS